MSPRTFRLFALIASAFRRQPTLVDDWRTRNDELVARPLRVVAGCTVYWRGADPTPYCTASGQPCSRRCSKLSD